jgi:hypothetical protein
MNATMIVAAAAIRAMVMSGRILELVFGFISDLLFRIEFWMAALESPDGKLARLPVLL